MTLNSDQRKQTDSSRNCCVYARSVCLTEIQFWKAGDTMEIKAGISLQTKQVLSQLQVESLNILAMSMTELKDFMQNERSRIHWLSLQQVRVRKQLLLLIKRRNGFIMVQNGKTAGKMSYMR